ncbi:Hypothetical predicted protein, partial [Mytilus galloprovincialis]
LMDVDESRSAFIHGCHLSCVDAQPTFKLTTSILNAEYSVFQNQNHNPNERSVVSQMISDMFLMSHCVSTCQDSNIKNMFISFSDCDTIIDDFMEENWHAPQDYSKEKGPGPVWGFRSGENLGHYLGKLHLPNHGPWLLLGNHDGHLDGDGQIEIVVAYSDRVVRCFRWRQDSSSDMLEAGTGSSTGNLIQISQWQLSGQIGSLTVNLSEEGKPELLVAQPGGTYVKLCLTVVTGGESPGQSESTFVEERLGSARIRNSMITTEIVGGINKGNRGKAGGGTFYALSTLDGTLILIENKEILWSLQVDHQLFALTKLDVTGNGTEEVVCCGWDGQTYIVNHTRDVVRYQFEENVTAFTAGLYSVNQKDNVPSFVYATFNNKIFIYYNITLPRVESTNLIEVMDKMEETHELLTKLNITDPDTSQLRELYHWLLYGWKPDLSLEDDKT